MTDIQDMLTTLERFSQTRVVCIGDVMLDRFVYGAIDRISPEAPIPVLSVEREKHMPGGAGNVVANLRALGVQTTLVSVVGKDAAGADLSRLLKEAGATPFLTDAADRMTTVKSRFVCGTQQMLRVDREKSHAIDAKTEDAVIADIEEAVAACDVVILSDYKKGVLTPRVIPAAIDAAKRAQKPVIVDPKGEDFSRYKGAAILTPNKKELEIASGMIARTDDDVRAAAMKLMMSSGVERILATRGAEGMSLIAADQPPLHIPARVREVFDVSGAGDTVIATLAAGIAAGMDFEAAAKMANIAAGIAVGKSGTATVTPAEIRAEVEKTSSNRKIKTLIEAMDDVERRRARGHKIVFTNGCFDLLHPGHLSTLRQAKAAGDCLIVGINSDASVKRLKGPTRPVQNQDVRADILSSLEMVDMVIVFDEDTPLRLIGALKPDLLAKGGQYQMEEVVGYDLVTAYGGKILRTDMEEGFSTTNTIARMK